LNVLREGDSLLLHFPPLRAPVAAAALGAFGLLAIIIPLLSASAAVPADGLDAHGLMALALLGGFVAPFILFGGYFAGLAVYLLVNSLSVHVDPRGIATQRRVLGVPVRRGWLDRADIGGIEAELSPRYENVFGAEPRYRLRATSRAGRASMVIGESITGEARVLALQADVERTLELPDTHKAQWNEGSKHDD
jgi:hypothetical protein